MKEKQFLESCLCNRFSLENRLNLRFRSKISLKNRTSPKTRFIFSPWVRLHSVSRLTRVVDNQSVSLGNKGTHKQKQRGKKE